MKLTIIVPVYGVEKYIEKCISSLLVPDYYEYEILVVDDGTKDRSIDIVKEKYCDSRIRIVHQDNAGLSAARNFGVMEANGDYVWFFDSDDWADTEKIPQIIKMLGDCEALALSHHYMNYDSLEQSVHGYTTNAQTGLELISQVFVPCAPFYIYKRDFLINNVCFFEKGLLHEDVLFTSTTLPLVKKLQIYTSPVYHHYMRKGSITHSYSPKRIMDCLYILNKLVNYGKTSIPKKNKYKWGKCIVAQLNGLLYLTYHSVDKELKNHVYKYINGNFQLLKYLIRSWKINEMIWGLLALLFGCKIATVYNILYKMKYRHKYIC